MSTGETLVKIPIYWTERVSGMSNWVPFYFSGLEKKARLDQKSPDLSLFIMDLRTSSCET